MQETTIWSAAEEKIKMVSRIYARIYNIFFKYLLFILAIIISIIILIVINNKVVNGWLSLNQTDNENIILASKQNFEKQQTKKIQNNQFQIKMVWGEINESPKKIKSVNNLLSAWWIILPRLIYLDLSQPIASMKIFQKKDYDKLELWGFVVSTILNKDIDFYTTKKNYKAPINNSISNTFFLECLNYNKVYTKVCNHYINKYVDDFFYYEISKDYIGFKTILNKLPQRKEEICTNLNKYILYSKDSSISKSIFDECGDKYVSEIQNTKAFVQINNEIENKYISEDIYNNKDLNAYKLLSSQQIIFKDFLNWKIPTERISNYLVFLGKVIKSNLIDIFYLDEAYRFNNYYLSDQIDKFEDYSDEESKRKIYSLVQNINGINYWNKLENIIWLENLISNQSLIKKYETIEDNTNRDNWTGRIQILSTEIGNSKYLIINNEKIEWDIIKINWYIKTESKGKKNLTNIDLELLYNWQMFVVNKIKVNGSDKINSLVNKFIMEEEKSLPEMYEYFEKIIWFYDDSESTQQTGKVNICNDIKNKIESWQINILSCSEKEISLSNKSTEYKFTYNKYIINDIIISNDNLNQEINDKFGWIKTNEENIINTIVNIVTFKDRVNFKTKYIDEDTVVKIERQIWPILEFAQSWDKLLFETNIKWIDFIINYDKSKKILGPMYFKNILVNTRPLIIRNIYIKLEDIEETKLFKTNPINYIKNKDKSVYYLYQKAN